MCFTAASHLRDAAVLYSNLMYAGTLFWTMVAGFLAGVAVTSVWSFGMGGFMFLLVLASALFIVFAMKPRASVIFLLALALSFAAFGMWRMNAAQANLRDPYLDSAIGREVRIEGVILSEPDVREQTVRLNLRGDVLIANGKSGVVSANILIVVPLPFDVEYKDKVAAEGKLTIPSSFETDTGREFNYPQFLAKEGIAYEISFPEVEKLEDAGLSLRGSLFALKREYIEGLGRALPEPHASLAGGITVGDKRSLGDDLLRKFRETGIIHIVVLSGYNLTIISDNILRLLSRAPQNFSIGLGVLGIVLFASMTGGSASIIRASAMAILALIARATGKRYATTRALALAAAGMVLWSPHVLVFDPGFQLSVLATLGLIHIAPILEEKWTWIPSILGVRGVVAATLGTQLFVLPLLLYQTGFVSLAAIPVNLLVLASVPYAMFFSFVAGVAGALAGDMAIFAGVPAQILLSYAFLVVDIFAGAPFVGFSLQKFSLLWVAGAYALMGAWLYRRFLKEKEASQVR